MFSSFPFEAITEAAKQSEYTITDKGTWLTVKDKTGYDVADKLQVFVNSPFAKMILTTHTDIQT